MKRNAAETPARQKVAALLQRLHTAAAAIAQPEKQIKLMEVCGTHTMSAFRSGLHSLLPENVTLLSGPGCPVCVTAQSDIDLLLEFTRIPNVILCTYGDMLRVPSHTGNLERARAQGADIRIIYSTLDAVSIAQANPHKQVVLAAVGFETTAPATAAAILHARSLGLKNFSAFTSHKRVVPAMAALLEAGQVHVDGFLCPGHVSAITGIKIYRWIPEKYRLPCVVSGFEEIHMTGAITRLVEMIRDGRADLVNDYPEAVNARGNPHALGLLAQVFEPGTVRWRALGELPDSGLVLRQRYREFDAARRFHLHPPPDAEIPGCICAKVIVGAATPHGCKLFARACTPINPIGPCMVSSEGTCQAWFKYARIPSRFSGSFLPHTAPVSPAVTSPAQEAQA